MAAALALAFSPAYAGDAQKEMTQAQQEAKEQTAEAQKEASETKADAQREASEAQADAQKEMREADREASEKTAEAQREASEKTREAREDMSKEGREVRAAEDRASDRAASATAGSAATADPDKVLSKTAKETLQKLHASSQMEVGMARLAKDKAQNDKVKDLAEKIEEDHQDFADKAAEIARERNIELAAHGDMDKNRKHVEQMEKMQGASFDRHFAQMMEKEHKKEIAELRKAHTKLSAGNEADKEVADLVEDALPKMEEHEKLAMEAQTELGSQQRQGRRGSMDSDRTTPSTTGSTGTTDNTNTQGNNARPRDAVHGTENKEGTPTGSSTSDGSSDKKY
jgi:predicted outer membrane protein